MGSAASANRYAASDLRTRQMMSANMKANAHHTANDDGFAGADAMTGGGANFRVMVKLETNECIIQHYMPTTFPMEATLDMEMIAIVRRTWGLIMDGEAEGMKGHTHKAGIVLFYDEFFFRLFKRARIFLDIFPDPAKRAIVLMKAMGLMMRLKGDDSEEENLKLSYLGRNHRFKSQLRPWMFSVYIVTALETLMFWLGSDADVDTGEAWTCLNTYVLRRMLRAYLPDLVVPNEYYQNYEIEAVRQIVTNSMHSKNASQYSLGSQQPTQSQGGQSQPGESGSVHQTTPSTRKPESNAESRSRAESSSLR